MPPRLARWLGRNMPPVTRPPRLTPADWPRVTAPTMVIWGEQDVALEKSLTEGTEQLIDAPYTIHYVPESGHWVQQECPELVNGYLLDFLADLDQPRSAATPASVAP